MARALFNAGQVLQAFGLASAAFLPIIALSLATTLAPAWAQQAGTKAQAKQGSPSGRSAEELKAAREFIQQELDPYKRRALEEMAKARGSSPEEVFLSLSGPEALTLGTAYKQAECRRLAGDYANCSRARGACAAACKSSVCQSRQPSLSCDVAPNCSQSC